MKKIRWKIKFTLINEKMSLLRRFVMCKEEQLKHQRGIMSWFKSREWKKKKKKEKERPKITLKQKYQVCHASSRPQNVGTKAWLLF